MHFLLILGERYFKPPASVVGGHFLSHSRESEGPHGSGFLYFYLSLSVSLDGVAGVASPRD